MLNRVVLMGRITHDLEPKTLSSGVTTLSFTVAVERNYPDLNKLEMYARNTRDGWDSWGNELTNNQSS